MIMNIRTNIKCLVAGVALMAANGSTLAQQRVTVGKGSYAEYAPLSKSKTDEHGGDQSQFMQYRPLNIREAADKPIPTNDWWTNLINGDDKHSGNELTGHLWSYPQYVQGMKYGLDIHYPKYWVDNGTEMKAQSKLTVKGGDDFYPSVPMAEKWSDWTVTFSESDGDKKMLTTLAHGVPFTWIEMNGISPIISAEKTNNDGADNLLNGNTETTFLDTDGKEMADGICRQFVVSIKNNATQDLYGVYLPNDAEVSITNGKATINFKGAKSYVVVGLLKSCNDLNAYASYARSKPTDTRVTWNYSDGQLTTQWQVEAKDLDTDMPTDNVMQGFIPHHYRERYATYSHTFIENTYDTPRGKLKLATGKDLSIGYKFSGMLPWYAVPNDVTGDNAFDSNRMIEMIQKYAETGTFGIDTYWGGKSLTQMALNMTFAREMGNEQLFRQCHDRLKDALVNWLTYTPGEDNFFFAYDKRFHGLVGYNTSYDSETYNDHHFHYGYFTLAAALLALVDDDFRENYGGMILLVARDYANYKRDSWACFLRTMDPWAGHSYAGGLGDGAGNGQESTSEAMQGWGGLYLLGVALRDNEMRDAGIFGWVTEARATAEYWYDRHGEAVGNDFHTGKNEDYNIDYTKFKHTRDGIVDYTIPYSSNLTSHGVGWWTWFGGDPVFMQGIQWMPISPALDYLGEDKAFAEWDYQRLMALKEHVGWEDYSGSAAWLGNSDWGNVVLSYRQWSDPDDAAAIFDKGWNNNWPTMRTSSTNGITYFVTHSHRSWGDIDWSVTSNCPTARAYVKNGTKTHVAFNPTDEAITVTYSDGTSLVVPARQMKIEGVESTACNYIYPVDNTEPDLRERLVMKNIALGKACTASSEENAGTLKQNATDGDLNTRWGSEHNDGEWIQIDLGEKTSVYKVKVKWEAACASEYRIELRDTENGEATYRKTGNGQPNAWTEMKLDDQSGRYVRLVGVKRATAYGTSLYEIEVYGRPDSAAGSDLMGVEISSDKEVLKEGEASQINIVGYDYAKNKKNISATWSSTDGTITETGMFTPAHYGTVTVKAEADGMSMTKEFTVEESRRVKSMVLNVPSAMIVGKAYAFTVDCKDQFGAPITAVPDIEGNVTIDKANLTMTASATGKYNVTAKIGDIEQSAEIFVIDRAVEAPESLAGKVPVFVGSVESGMNFTYNGGSTKDGEIFNLTENCRVLSVSDLGTCGFGALNNMPLEDCNMIHVDIYPTNDAPDFSIHIEGEPSNKVYGESLVGGQWNSIDLPVSNTTANWIFLAFNNYQSGDNKALIANLYFYHVDDIPFRMTTKDDVATITGCVKADDMDAINTADVMMIDMTGVSEIKEPVTLNPKNPNALVKVSGTVAANLATADAKYANLTAKNQVVVDIWVFPVDKLEFTDGVNVRFWNGEGAPQTFISTGSRGYKITRRLTANGYYTTCLPVAVSPVNGIEVYEFTRFANDKITFTKKEGGYINANNPYLLKATSDVELVAEGTGDLGLSNINGTETIDGITLKGNGVAFHPTADSKLVGLTDKGKLAPLGTEATVGSFRAYFDISGVTTTDVETAVARMSIQIGDDDTTGINSINAADDNESSFNLKGMKVAPGNKGIVVKKGKKIVR